MDREELSDHEDKTADHLNDFLDEVARRDAWLINSIWNVMRGLSHLTLLVVIGFIILFFELTEWWQLLLAFVIFTFLTWRQDSRLRKLEEDDKDKIGRDSVLGSFGSWWR